MKVARTFALAAVLGFIAFVVIAAWCYIAVLVGASPV